MEAAIRSHVAVGVVGAALRRSLGGFAAEVSAASRRGWGGGAADALIDAPDGTLVDGDGGVGGGFAAKDGVAGDGALGVLVQGVGGVGGDKRIALLVVVRGADAVANRVVGVVVVEAADGRIGKSAAGGDNLGAKVVAVGVRRARKVAEGRAAARDGRATAKGVVGIVVSTKW